jgi:hypothetical protein
MTFFKDLAAKGSVSQNGGEVQAFDFFCISFDLSF